MIGDELGEASFLCLTGRRVTMIAIYVYIHTENIYDRVIEYYAIALIDSLLNQ